MKTIKLIDLLNMIANDEEVPKFVQYYDINDRETKVMLVCIESIVYKLEHQKIHLNSRVEIIEEDNKIPEKLNIEDDGNTITLFGEKENEWTILDNVDVIVCNKINSIIDYLESKEKGE